MIRAATSTRPPWRPTLRWLCRPDSAAPHLHITPDGRYVHITRARTGNGSGLAVLDTTTNTIVHERPMPHAYASAAETSPNGAYLSVVGNKPKI